MTSELTKREKQGYATLEGRVLWSDLVEPGGAPGFAPKYGCTIQVSKDSPTMGRLFEVMQDVARKTWGDGLALERLQEIQRQIESGVEPKKADCSIQDGDVVQSEYNTGFYLIKASRRVDQGRPTLLSREGFPIYSGGELTRPIEEAPKAGDGVVLVVKVWAQRKFTRINFTVEVVRRAIEGAPTQIAGTTPEQQAELVEDIAAAPLPTQIAGVQTRAQIGAGDTEECSTGNTQQSVAEPAREVPETPAEVAAQAPTRAKRTSLFRQG